MKNRIWALCLTVLLLAPLAACSDGGQSLADKGQAGEKNLTPRPAAADSAIPADAPLILAFGDSLYAGYGLAPNEGFAPALQRSLAAQGHVVRVHNAGVSGDTTAAGLARLSFTLDGLPRKPDLAIVGLGGNDMLRGLSPDETRRNLDAIVSMLTQRQIPVVLTGMLASPNMGADYAAAFNPIFPDLARKYDAVLYPFFLEGVVTRPELILPDGIHPNAQGISLIVERITPVVVAELPEE